MPTSDAYGEYTLPAHPPAPGPVPPWPIGQDETDAIMQAMREQVARTAGRLAHGDTCYACTDPAAAARQMAAERAELDAEAIRAYEHRAAGEAFQTRARDNLIAGRPAASAALDMRALQHLQLANALASGVRISRAHLDRVEAAHPNLPPLPRQEQPSPEYPTHV